MPGPFIACSAETEMQQQQVPSRQGLIFCLLEALTWWLLSDAPPLAGHQGSQTRAASQPLFVLLLPPRARLPIPFGARRWSRGSEAADAADLYKWPPVRKHSHAPASLPLPPRLAGRAAPVPAVVPPRSLSRSMNSPRLEAEEPGSGIVLESLPSKHAPLHFL